MTLALMSASTTAAAVVIGGKRWPTDRLIAPVKADQKLATSKGAVKANQERMFVACQLLSQYS